MSRISLNLFYEEPDPDRWLPLDRFPRRVLRRVVRGRKIIGGQERLFLNLCAGLDKLGIEYRVNDYRYIKSHKEDLACIVGKSHLLRKMCWRNPILFGAAVFTHPLEDPNLLTRLPVKNVLVPGEWMRKMWAEYYGDAVVAWPVGVDTALWSPDSCKEKQLDVLVYDKVRWNHDRYEQTLMEPIRVALRERALSFLEIRYGYYHEEEFLEALHRCRAMIFLCEHETQGIAYQQALAVDVPIFAWDRGGMCCDPVLSALKIEYGVVSSVPYWDSRCGTKFIDISNFHQRFEQFWCSVKSGDFHPREYVTENLTLEKCATRYLEIAAKVMNS